MDLFMIFYCVIALMVGTIVEFASAAKWGYSVNFMVNAIMSVLWPALLFGVMIHAIYEYRNSKP